MFMGAVPDRFYQALYGNKESTGEGKRKLAIPHVQQQSEQHMKLPQCIKTRTKLCIANLTSLCGDKLQTTCNCEGNQ